MKEYFITISVVILSACTGANYPVQRDGWNMTCGAQTYDVVIFDDMACLNGGAGFNMCPKKIQDELYAGDGAFLFRDDAGWRISKENIMYGNGGAGYGESKKCKINRGYNFNEIEAMLANLCGLRTECH